MQKRSPTQEYGNLYHKGSTPETGEAAITAKMRSLRMRRNRDEGRKNQTKTMKRQEGVTEMHHCQRYISVARERSRSGGIKRARRLLHTTEPRPLNLWRSIPIPTGDHRNSQLKGSHHTGAISPISGASSHQARKVRYPQRHGYIKRSTCTLAMRI